MMEPILTTTLTFAPVEPITLAAMILFLGVGVVRYFAD